MQLQVVNYINAAYPDAKMLDRGPIISNMQRWTRRLRAALARVTPELTNDSP